MENANVLLVEDLRFAKEVVRQKLAKSSHKIVREVARLDEALAAVDDIACGRLSCDVVILDGDLEQSRLDLITKPVGHGAAEVVSRIREHELKLKVIGFSANAMSEIGVMVDVDLQKHGTADLVATIDAF